MLSDTSSASLAGSKTTWNVQIRSVWDMVKPVTAAVLLPMALELVELRRRNEFYRDMCTPCQLRCHFWQSHVRNKNSKGSKRRSFAISSSWISGEKISQSIMSNCWQKLRQPYWGCFGPTRGRISDEKCSRNARWTISCETKSSLVSLVFS